MSSGTPSRRHTSGWGSRRIHYQGVYSAYVIARVHRLFRFGNLTLLEIPPTEMYGPLKLWCVARSNSVWAGEIVCWAYLPRLSRKWDEKKLLRRVLARFIGV